MKQTNYFSTLIFIFPDSLVEGLSCCRQNFITSMKVLLLVVLSVCCYSVRGQNKLSSKELNEDFEFLIDEFKAQHQGLYHYMTINQTDKKIDSIRNTLEDPQSKLEFYQNLRCILGLTNEGHTSIELPKWDMLKFGISKSFVPVAVKLCDGELIVTQNFGKDFENLSKGVKLISINGKNINEVLEQLFPYIPTDGFNETSRHEWVGGLNFSLLYRLVYGQESSFELQVKKFGGDQIFTIITPAVRFAKFKSKNAKYESQRFDYEYFNFEQINDSIAYLSIPSFDDDQIEYDNFYESIFKKLDSMKTKHLIIDIQANGGGTEGNENLLFSYLSYKVVQKYKQVTMLAKPYLKNKEKQGYIEDQWRFEDSLAKRGAYTLFSDYYSDLGYTKPKNDLIYSGKVYVLTSGRTFSGGAEFASLIKMSNRGVFIGEETGGACEGNVSGYAEYIELPNSHIEIKIPTVHFQMNISPKIRGRGVIPEYKVSQSWIDYMTGNNSKKDFTIKMLTK